MALLLLALKSVSSPQAVNESDIAAVRVKGWSNRDYFDVVVQAGNTLACNHVVSSFNVEHQGAFA